MRPSRHSFLLLALLGTAAAVPAFAQSAQPVAALTVYPTCDRTPSHDDSEAAHNAFLLGKRKYDEADYPNALIYFKDAYKTDCTKHELLPIISNTYERKGDKAEAVNALEVYLKRMPSAPDADVQTKRIANLKAQIAEQQRPVGTATASAPPPPTSAATLAAPAPVPETGGHTLTPWIVVGAGGVMTVTGVILLAVGAGKVSEVNNACAGHVCPSNSGFTKATAEAQDGQGKTLENVGGVVAGLGVAALAGGLIWHFVEKPATKEAPHGALHFQPGVAAGYAGGSLVGRF